MSSSGASAALQQYFCYQCEHEVTITSPTIPSDELVCPDCHGGFLELVETAPDPSSNPINSFFDGGASSVPRIGRDFIFSSLSSSAPGSAAFSLTSGDGGGFEDISALFGSRSPSNEFNPMAFLNNYINNLQARGANIQLVFESEGGGDRFDFQLPNSGDYFVGPGFEQLMQQLAENDPNRYGTPPASKSAVNGLPDVKISKEILASDSSQCAVCTDSFELNEEAKQMPCSHVYHKDCILPWLELHNSCPVCRYELPTDDPDYENQRTGQVNLNDNNLGSRATGENGDNSNNNNNASSETPNVVERRFRISLPGIFRGFGSQAETSNRGGERAGNNDSHDNSGAPSTGSGGG